MLLRGRYEADLDPGSVKEAVDIGWCAKRLTSPNYKYLKLQGENCKIELPKRGKFGFLKGNSSRGVVVAVFLLFSISWEFRATGNRLCQRIH
jgi:hypothetical protein